MLHVRIRFLETYYTPFSFTDNFKLQTPEFQALWLTRVWGMQMRLDIEKLQRFHNARASFKTFKHTWWAFQSYQTKLTALESSSFAARLEVDYLSASAPGNRAAIWPYDNKCSGKIDVGKVLGMKFSGDTQKDG